MKSDLDKLFKNTEMITEDRYMEVIKPIMDLSISRSEKYGSSINIMEDTSIIDLVMMKLVRTKELVRGGYVDDKYYDEISDSINYLVYILRRQMDTGQEIVITNGKHNKGDDKWSL